MNDVSGEIRLVAPGNYFDLRAFSGRRYTKGRPVAVQFLWMIVSLNITMRWWCPNVLRVAVLRAFGAVIGSGVLVRHDVKILSRGHLPFTRPEAVVRLPVEICRNGRWAPSLQDHSFGSVVDGSMQSVADAIITLSILDELGNVK